MRIRFLSWLPLFVLILPVQPCGAEPAAKRPTFAAVVESHFTSWDHDHDGKLSGAEINAQVVNPRVTDTEAAAVAALHIYLREHKDAPPLTKAFILQTPGKDTAERRDVTRKKVHFGSDYASFCNHLSKVPRDVFADKDSPSLIGFKQGNLGDCYFLATVSAALHADPSAFRRMFQPRPDGSCEVRFYSGHVLHLPRLTDAEIVLGSSAGSQGLWLNVAEKAFGEVRLQMRKTRPTTRNALDLDIIAHGGYVGDAIEMLCGTKAQSITIRKGKNSDPPAPHELPRLQAQLHQLFSMAIPRKFLCCCSVASSHANAKYPAGIVTDHAYAILGYDPRTQTVTVRNPWGNHFEPKGTPGLANGYSTKNGMFDVPLNEFLHIFEEVNYQTALAPKRH
jgi:hypothetical protein